MPVIDNNNNGLKCNGCWQINDCPMVQCHCGDNSACHDEWCMVEGGLWECDGCDKIVCASCGVHEDQDHHCLDCAEEHDAIES